MAPRSQDRRSKPAESRRNGHIHEDYGVRRLHPGSETIVANAALLDVDYQPVPEREPLVFEL